MAGEDNPPVDPGLGVGGRMGRDYRPVDRVKRGAMTPARKRRIWEAAKGLCEVCGDPVEASGPTVRFDHRVPLWTSGDDSDANIRPIHRQRCDEKKCADDMGDIAKIKRLIAKREGTAKPKRPIPNRGFNKTITKGFDGKVRRR